MTESAKEIAKRELAMRVRSRLSLVDYARLIDVPGRPPSDDPQEWLYHPAPKYGIDDESALIPPIETPLAAHHVLILTVAEKVIKGEIPRAMYFLPPGSAKSTYLSVVTPTWAMGKTPGTKLILASYGSDLAKKHGRRARQIVKSEQYQRTFKTSLSRDTSAADEWALDNESEYMSCGILSGITGNRAAGIIIDDPIKGRQEADSDTVRARTWDVYMEDLRTRLLPGGWELIILTRWHEDDLAGRILPENYAGESGMIRCRDGRDWYIVCLPAQAERSDDLLGRGKGEYLWPEWFSEEHFRPFRAISRTWSALFQQRPSPETGTYFQRQWFKRYNVLPEHMHLYGSSDYGVTADEHAGSGISGGNSEENSTEHGVLGVAESGDVYLVDAWHGKTTSDVWIEKQLDLVQAHKPFAWFGESGVIRRAVEPFLKRRMQERRAYVREEWIASVADKPTRARALQAWAAQGRVHIPEGMMGDRIIEQLVKFPTSAVDDAVDMLSLFFLALDMAHPAIVQTGTRIKRVSMAEARIDHITKTDESMQDEAFIRAEKEYAERYVHRAGEQKEYFYDVE